MKKASRSFEMWGAFYTSTRCNIPKDLELQKHCFEIHKFHNRNLVHISGRYAK